MLAPTLAEDMHLKYLEGIKATGEAGEGASLHTDLAVTSGS